MRIYGGRNSFYQWDVNQKVTAENMDVGEEIHFTNNRQTAAFVVKAYEMNGAVVADVPNILLQNSYSIIAYRYKTVGNVSYTWDETLFDVEQRIRPADYVYTQTEIISYERLATRLDELQERYEQLADEVQNIDCNYELPIADEDTLGGIKVKSGSGIDVDGEGFISMDVDFATEDEVVALLSGNSESTEL